MVSEKLLNPVTGEEFDGVDPWNNCAITTWTFDYEYGVLLQALIQLSAATKNPKYMSHASIYTKFSLNKWASTGVIDDGCDATHCDMTALAFRGVYVQGLGRYYDETHDASVENAIVKSYFAMLNHRQGTYYPMGWINGDSKQLTGDPLTIAKFTNLALATAAIKVFKKMKGSSPSLDNAVQGLLPFTNGNLLFRACVCDDFACPFKHDMQCFTDDGHHDAESGTTWHNNVGGFLIGPNHTMILWTDQGDHSDWYSKSVWYNTYRVGSINIDHF